MMNRECIYDKEHPAAAADATAGAEKAGAAAGTATAASSGEGQAGSCCMERLLKKDKEICEFIYTAIHYRELTDLVRVMDQQPSCLSTVQNSGFIYERNQLKVFLLSGSCAEGGMTSRLFGSSKILECEGDMMCPYISVKPEMLRDCIGKPGYFCIAAPKYIPRSFIALKRMEEVNIVVKTLKSAGEFISAKPLIEWILSDNHDYIVNGFEIGFFEELFNQKLHRKLETIRKGPACLTHFEISVVKPDGRHGTPVEISVDYVTAIRVMGWPTAANEWITRSRKHGWPSKELIDMIARKGCFLVPKEINHVTDEGSSCRGNPDEHWRISFSLSEREIALARTESQQLCYFYMKAIFYNEKNTIEEECEKLKPNQNKAEDRPQVGSFLIKTIFMWACEEIDIDTELATHGMKYLMIYLFTRLSDCLEVKCLSNYFIPGMNVIGDYKEEEHKLARDIIRLILKKLDNETFFEALESQAESNLQRINKFNGIIETTNKLITDLLNALVKFSQFWSDLGALQPPLSDITLMLTRGNVSVSKAKVESCLDALTRVARVISLDYHLRGCRFGLEQGAGAAVEELWLTDALSSNRDDGSDLLVADVEDQSEQESVKQPPYDNYNHLLSALKPFLSGGAFKEELLHCVYKIVQGKPRKTSEMNELELD